jgi:hypothetical protein
MPRVPESLRGLEVDLVFPEAPSDHQLRFAEKLAHLEHLDGDVVRCLAAWSIAAG